MNYLEPKDIHAAIETLQRTPFQSLLAEYLQCMPSRTAIQEFAETYPDRFAKALKDLSALAGYQDSVTHNHNYLVDIRGLPDSELDARMRDLEKQLNTIEGEVSEVIIEGD